MKDYCKRYRIELKGDYFHRPDWFAHYLFIAKIKAKIRFALHFGCYDVQIRDTRTGRYVSEQIEPPIPPNCGA